MITCSKIYKDIPFAHRQPNHDGHCKFIHGHNWAFKFTFGARELDENGFVVDFGKLKWLKTWLDAAFDHSLVLNADDPALVYLQDFLEKKGLAEIFVVPNCGAEGLAKYLLEKIGEQLRHQTADRKNGTVYLLEVEVFEDERNSAKATQDEFYHE
jgi:6-pyruvoyltetrahydropterin/6-carboxytetrahydropterin synthase